MTEHALHAELKSSQDPSEAAVLLKKAYFLTCVFFFISGAAALIYEVMWVRLLGIVFGQTTYAISTVLAAYMAGLGLGSYVMGKISEKINALTSAIQPLTDLTHPLNDQLLQVKNLKNGVLDSLKSVADMYADTTYGIDKVFPGRTYFYYQNKGVFDIIDILVKSKNYVVAICIGLFSFIIPCIKLGASLFMLLFPKFSSRRAQSILSFISKWSMADVFVVGAFLSYLSFSNMSPGVDVEANIVFGLYFFLCYVIISILLGALLKRSINESALLETKNN